MLLVFIFMVRLNPNVVLLWLLVVVEVVGVYDMWPYENLFFIMLPSHFVLGPLVVRVLTPK